jgi:hypothetical protein
MLVSTQMITGFNTDVRHEGHVYHVQTEDRGTENPILESLVYIGGTIVARKKTPYPRPLNQDAGHEALASLLKRQHQVIIAAIKAGRIEELIQHTLKHQTLTDADEVISPFATARPPERPPDSVVQPHIVASEPIVSTQATTLKISEPAPVKRPDPPVPLPVEAPAISVEPPLVPKPAEPINRPGEQKSSVNYSGPRSDTAGLNLDQVLEDYQKRGAGQAKLDVKVITPEVFTSGKGIGLRVQVTHDSKPDFNATVTVKIIGTAFRPQVFIGRVGRDGVANFSLTLPSFNTGTAAIVIEAQSGTGRGELKKLIRRT